MGVIIESKLTVKNHVEHVKLKVNKKIAFMKRFTKKFRDVNSYKSLYYSYIYPSIVYCSVVWRPSLGYVEHDLEKLNHKYLSCL